MGKFVGKFRQERDYFDDFNGKPSRMTRRKGKGADVKKQKERMYEDDYGYEDVRRTYRQKH